VTRREPAARPGEDAEPEQPARQPSAPAPISTGLGRYLGVLRYGDLRLVWLAQLISQVGDGMMTVALVWVTLSITRSPTALSGVLVAQTLPYLFGIFAGALVDRWPRLWTMLFSDLIRGGVVLAVPILDAFSGLHIWELIAMSFALGAAQQFFDPAKAALTPSLVPPDDLVEANAVLQATRQILFIGGPAIGGAVIAAVGSLGVFYVDALSFFGSAAVLAFLFRRSRRGVGEAKQPSGGAILRDIRDGFGYIVKKRVLLVTIAVGAVLNFLLSPLPLLIPLYIKQVVKDGALQFGTLTSVVFVGFLVGAVVVGRLAKRVGKGRLAGLSIVGAGIASAGFALGLPIWPTMGIGAVGGACIAVASISAQTIVQEQSADEFRGRVYASYDSLTQMGRPLSLILGAFAADALGIRPVFLLVGVLAMLSSTPILAVRSLRNTP
jgi:MFS family permease